MRDRDGAIDNGGFKAEIGTGVKSRRYERDNINFLESNATRNPRARALHFIRKDLRSRDFWKNQNVIFPRNKAAERFSRIIGLFFYRFFFWNSPRGTCVEKFC